MICDRCRHDRHHQPRTAEPRREERQERHHDRDRQPLVAAREGAHGEDPGKQEQGKPEKKPANKLEEPDAAGDALRKMLQGEKREVVPPPDGVERIIEPFFDDPFPDYDTEPVYLSSEALA